MSDVLLIDAATVRDIRAVLVGQPYERVHALVQILDHLEIATFADKEDDRDLHEMLEEEIDA